MAADETIGSLGVDIIGDSSPLEQAVQDVTSAGTSGARQIGAAFDMPDTDAALVAAMERIGYAATETSDQMSLFAANTQEAFSAVEQQHDLFDTKSIDAAESLVQVGDAGSQA